MHLICAENVMKRGMTKMADEFEVIFSGMLVVAFAVTCYLAGKGNLLELVPKMLQEKADELSKQKERAENFICGNCGLDFNENFKVENPPKYCPKCGINIINNHEEYLKWLERNNGND